MSALADLFPNTRAEILRLLFGDDRREAHLRDLARHAGLSAAAVQRELSALAVLELVVPRRDGKAGPKQRVKGTYKLPTNEFRVKIRNIAGDEIILDHPVITAKS